MKLTCDYKALVGALADVAVVVDDSLSNDAAKVIVFCVNREDSTVKLLGRSSQIRIRRRLLESTYKVEFSDNDPQQVVFGLKSKELISFLNAYKSLRRTKVESIGLETTARGIVCTVVEVNLDDENDKDERISAEILMEGMMEAPAQQTVLRKPIVSNFAFVSIPVDQTVLNDLALESPTDGLVPLDKGIMLQYTKNLFPLMQNSTSIVGYLHFSDDYVFVYTSTYTVFVTNLLADQGVFKNIKLQYKCVNFINTLMEKDGLVDVGLMDNFIYMKNEVTEAFFVYDTKFSDYKMLVDAFKKDNMFSVDRIYLKDVLKRLSLTNDSIEVAINGAEKLMTVTNSKFSQDIFLNNERGMTQFGTLKFKIMPEVLNKAIIGADDDFVRPDVENGCDTYSYFTKIGRSSMLVFADSTGLWFSVVNVKTY